MAKVWRSQQSIERRRQYAIGYAKIYSRREGFKEYRAKKEYKWRQSMRHFLSAYKMAQGCTDCGYCVSPVALDFDHVRGEKKYNLSRLTKLSWNKMLTEMGKCVIRCANCHRIRHSEEKNGNAK